MEVVTGDLLEATEQYIVHQTNCLTVRAARLAADVFAQFPHANVYAERGRLGVVGDRGGLRHVPGTLEVRGHVINLMGQLGPGNPKGTLHVPGVGAMGDAPRLRKIWFQAGLDRIAALPGITSVAFPYGIGCGAAAGDWAAYSAMLQAFATANPHIRVRVYKWDPGVAAAAGAGAGARDAGAGAGAGTT